MSKPIFDIAVALVHHEGRWLVALRPEDAHLGGLWEFPGGKCEAGEDPAQTAVRELGEECGVHAHAEHTLDPVLWEYDDRIVHITPVICRWQSGEPRPLQSEICRWVRGEELARLNMPEVNARVIAAAMNRVGETNSRFESGGQVTTGPH